MSTRWSSRFFVIALAIAVSAFQANVLLAQRPPSAIYPFCDSEGKWGYQTDEGAVALVPQFALAGEFADGLAPVEITKDEGYRFIDANGKPVDGVFQLADVFSEHLATVRLDGRFGFVRYADSKLDLAIKPVFTWAGPFHDQRAAFQHENGSYGFIDLRGEQVVRAQFSRVLPFSNGLAAVEQDGRWGYIDKAGNTVLKPQYGSASRFASDRAWASSGEVLLCISRSGETAIDTTFDAASTFSNGLASVRLDGKSGLIDPTGKLVVELQQGPVWKPYPFKSGLFHSGKNVVVSKIVGGKTFYEQKVDDRFKTIKFESSPAAAKVYCPTLWDFKHAANRQATMTAQYRLLDGDTNTKSSLNRGQRYWVIFEKDGKVEEREVAPDKVIDAVKVTFQ